MQRIRSQGEISSSPRSSTDSVGSSSTRSSQRSQPTYHRAGSAGSSRFSHPRPAPSPPAAASTTPASPIIANSAFAHLDYFAPARPLPSSTLVKRSNTIATRTVSYTPTTPIMNKIDLASPRVPESPECLSTKRRTVQFGESSSVNWARPLRSTTSIPEDRPASPVRLLGSSLQRTRRLAKSPMLDTPSPVSSLDESPMTPTTPESATALRSWTLPTEANVKGLGFEPDFDWSSTASGSTASESGSALADYLESSSSTPSRGTPTPRHSRILSSSESFIELSSPSTLHELQHLRQAALDLQAEALPHRRPKPTETIHARRIRRKAVPSFDISGEVEVGPPAMPQLSADTTFVKPMRVLSMALPPPSPSTSTSISPSSSLSSSPSLPLRKSPASSSSGAPRKAFYASMAATRSVIEISPRTSSLPFMPSHQSMRSRLSSSSASTSDADEPITPGATTERDTFAQQVEAGLRALNMSAIDLGSFANDGARKQKRGISRFFRKTPIDL